MSSSQIKKINNLREAVNVADRITSSTHTHYRYPARFHPHFVRTAILEYTRVGDLVVDPFMGGGTTLVESKLTNRNSVGTDVNELAQFVVRSKLLRLSKDDVAELQEWAFSLEKELNVFSPLPRKYQVLRNKCVLLSNDENWRLSKLVEIANRTAERLRTNTQTKFAKSVLLNVSQWAFDCKEFTPSVDEFRLKLFSSFSRMMKESINFSRESRNDSWCKIYKCKASSLERKDIFNYHLPRLIITSPPYPGIKVLYNKWQIHGRKETTAHYSLIDAVDGMPPKFYTMGSKTPLGMENYFDSITETFSSLRNICERGTTIIQMIAFSEPKVQLFQYLKCMEEAGFKELNGTFNTSRAVRRIWRPIHNRKWYLRKDSDEDNERREVVLIHRMR